MLDFQKLTISNNFMFRIVMEKKELCKTLLERILDIKIKDLSYPEGEKSLEAQIIAKGVRLDIYVTLYDGTVIDIEMQVTEMTEENLAKRTRYYQSLLDMDALKKGERYTKLRKNIIIFICTFDPFNKNLPRYTFHSSCKEMNNLILKDESYKIFLNTKGDRHKISKELAYLLDYINGEKPSDDFTKKLDEDVELEKNDASRRKVYMMYSQMVMEIEEQAMQKGIEKGIEKGIDFVAKKLLHENIPIECITRVTGIEEARLSELQKQ